MPIGVTNQAAVKLPSVDRSSYPDVDAQSASSSAIVKADSYIASFARGQFQGYVQFGSHDTLNISEDQNGRDPSFVGAAGKSFRVKVDPNMFKTGENPTLYWAYSTKNQKGSSSAPLEFARDLRSGALLPAIVNIDIPKEARGIMRLRLEAIRDGEPHVQWDPKFDVKILPQTGAQIHFDSNWQANTIGEIRAGDSLDLAYDMSRLRRILGENITDAVACVQFDERPAVEFNIGIKQDGQIDSHASFSPRIQIPYEAESMKIWFKGEANGQIVHDSRFGENFKFDVGLPRGDSNPAWKQTILSSRNAIAGLREDNFSALGPNNPLYNCIAWSIGSRHDWVWPGDTISDFDGLYAQHGYHPLDSVDDHALSHEPGVEKIAIYGYISNRPSRAKQGPVVTHAARQIDDGQWTSKLGSNSLIAHPDPRTIEGSTYGKLLKVYARTK